MEVDGLILSTIAAVLKSIALFTIIPNVSHTKEEVEFTTANKENSTTLIALDLPIALEVARLTLITISVLLKTLEAFEHPSVETKQATQTSLLSLAY
jgi:hypothetical protein